MVTTISQLVLKLSILCIIYISEYGLLLRRYPYFAVVVGLVRSHDPESYATGRACHARQVKGDDPDKKRYTGPPGWGFGVGLTTPPSKKEKLTVTEVEQRKKLDSLNDDGRKKTRCTEITLATWKLQTALKPGRMKEIKCWE